MKSGQLTEYNISNIFIEKSCKKCVGETFPRSFFEKSKLSLSLNQQSGDSYRSFLLCV